VADREKARKRRKGRRLKSEDALVLLLCMEQVSRSAWKMGFRSRGSLELRHVWDLTPMIEVAKSNSESIFEWHVN
jgi:hypothetical protein